MNAITHMLIEHPFASSGLALTFLLWIVVYAATRTSEEPKTAPRATKVKSDPV